MVAYAQSVAEILEGERVFGQAAHAAKVRHASQSEHEVVVPNDVRGRLEALRGRHRSILQVNRFNLAHVEVCAGACGVWG